MAMGRPAEEAYAAMRFSLGKQTTEAEIEYALECLPEEIDKLRAMSPLWNG